MTWMKAFGWATPVWIVTIGMIGASMFLTDFATDIGMTESLTRLCLVAFVGLPLIAFLIRATVNDVMKFRVLFLKKDADGNEQ